VDTFGKQLKQERESRNVALDEIARSTKIRVRYLQALEEGQHERLPGIVFAKGYIRAFAETIGADADRLVATYVEEQRALGRLESEASQERVLEALATAVQDNPDPAARRMKSAAVGALAIALLGLVGWFGVRPMMQRGDSGTDATPAPQAATMVPVRPRADPPTAEVDPVAVQVAEESTKVDTVTAPPDEGTSEPAEPETRIVTHEASPATDEPDPVEAPIEQDATALTIPDHGVGTGVASRALVGESSAFETGTQVVFWTRVLGGESGRSVRHIWSYEGSVTGTVELPIGATHWRTYSRQTLRRSGEWTVEAQDENGNVLARRTFVASPA